MNSHPVLCICDEIAKVTYEIVVERTLADELVEEEVADRHGGVREGVVADAGVVEYEETLDGATASRACKVMHVL